MSGIDPDAELSSLLQDVEKLTNNSRVISRSIAQYAAVARAAAVAATHHNPESANDENDENGGGGGGGDGDHPAESLEEQTIELRLVIRDGLRRQEDNVEIASQKLDNICAVPVYWSSMSSTGPIFEDSQYGSAIEIKDKLGLTIAKLTDDLKRSRNQFRRIQLQSHASKSSVRQRETESFIASMGAEFAATEKGEVPAQPTSTSQVPSAHVSATPQASSAQMTSTSHASSLQATPTPQPLTARASSVPRAASALSSSHGTAPSQSPALSAVKHLSQVTPSTSIRRKGARPARPARPTQESLRASAAEQVTSTLQQMLDQVLTQLARSQEVRESLERSSESLKDLANRGGNIDAILESSKSLVSTLYRSQKSDTWYLETSFYMLIVTIGWLVFRRWLYGPLWWFVWFPLKWGVRLAWFALSVAGILGTSSTHGGGATDLARSNVIQGEPMAISMGTGPRHGAAVLDDVPQIRIRDEDAGQDRAGSLSEAIIETILTNRPVVEATPSPSSASGSSQTGSSGAQSGRQRGDGQYLRDSDAPRNPMKRMWEEEPVEERRSDAPPSERDDHDDAGSSSSSGQLAQEKGQGEGEADVNEKKGEDGGKAEEGEREKDEL